MNYKLFTSESVCAGHPDKMCDAISDAIVDEALRQDEHARCGVEAVVGANQVSLFGEVTSTAPIDYQEIVRSTISKLGYTHPEWGFSSESPLSNFVHRQSPEIALGVDKDGAGDQGMMFGFACKETDELMPLPIMLAHALTKKIDETRESGSIPWIRPDGKAQVTVRYDKKLPVAIEKVVLAIAHDESIDPQTVREHAIQKIVQPVCERYGYDLPDYTNITVNGTGVWHIPGPDSDAGLTGRKIVVDTYGGYARVGGGAFSGKDPSKVDRSGAYAARYIAKNIVASGLAEQCEVALAYVIGQPKPLMQSIETFDTAMADIEDIEHFATNLLDTSVKGIIEGLELARPLYSGTSAYGHFGKPDLPWENIVS